MDAGNVFYTLVKSPSFSNLSRESGGLKTVAPGQHHALVLDRKGRAHVIGRVEYGRLGMGEDVKIDAKVPTAVPALKGKEVTDVSCGTAVSFAVVKSGEVYSWGMGTNGQLAAADDEDVWTPAKMLGKQLEERSVLLASGGGQGRDSPIFLQLFYLFSIFFLNRF
jgi:regulator of chromosome condensation